jgi:hypothetical protein
MFYVNGETPPTNCRPVAVSTIISSVEPQKCACVRALTKKSC